MKTQYRAFKLNWISENDGRNEYYTLQDTGLGSFDTQEESLNSVSDINSDHMKMFQYTVLPVISFDRHDLK